MRIIGGEYKRINLYGPINKKVRPLKDMVRENIFNFLTHSNKISLQLDKSYVLDLYSGVGSFGLECLSRRASKIVFIERENDAIKILNKNIDKLKVKKKIKIISGDVFNVINKSNKNLFDHQQDNKFDLIFCDPPFKDPGASDLVELIIKKNLLSKNGIVILHRHKNSKEKFTDNFKIIENRVYGLSKIIFGKFLI